MTSAASPRKIAFRVIRWLVVALAILILLPYLIAPLYRVINPVSTLMVGRWILGKRVERTWVPLQKVAPVLPRTVIASEDARFCSHRGVDMVEMRAAL
jgi:monofunctional biosynthetic peptidoglycan transglycosylase